MEFCPKVFALVTHNIPVAQSPSVFNVFREHSSSIEKAALIAPARAARRFSLCCGNRWSTVTDFPRATWQCECYEFWENQQPSLIVQKAVSSPVAGSDLRGMVGGATVTLGGIQHEGQARPLGPARAANRGPTTSGLRQFGDCAPVEDGETHSESPL
jgi:hypothetical protein